MNVFGIHVVSDIFVRPLPGASSVVLVEREESKEERSVFWTSGCPIPNSIIHLGKGDEANGANTSRLRIQNGPLTC